jgi:hypothetical protein
VITLMIMMTLLLMMTMMMMMVMTRMMMMMMMLMMISLARQGDPLAAVAGPRAGRRAHPTRGPCRPGPSHFRATEG